MAKKITKKKIVRKKKTTGPRDASLHVDRIAAPPPTATDRRSEQERAARDFSIRAARSLSDDKCSDVIVLDVRGQSQVTDFFVIASGTSDRQIRSSGDHVSELGDKSGFALHRHNLREKGSKWAVLDFVDIVVHIFEPETRRYYDIESLWGDAKPIEWERPADRKPASDDRTPSKPTRNRAGLTRDDVLPR